MWWKDKLYCRGWWEGLIGCVFVKILFLWKCVFCWIDLCFCVCIKGMIDVFYFVEKYCWGIVIYVVCVVNWVKIYVV